MDGDCAGLQGFRRVEGEGEGAVLHPDEVQSAAGGVEVGCGDGGDLISNEAGTGVEDEQVGGEPSGGDVEGGDESMDSGEGLRLRGVDAEDVGVGVGAAEDEAVSHVRQLEVGGVHGFAGEFFAEVAADGAVSGGGHGGRRLRWLDDWEG